MRKRSKRSKRSRRCREGKRQQQLQLQLLPSTIVVVSPVVVVVVVVVAQRSVVSHFNCLSLFNFQLFCYCRHCTQAYLYIHTEKKMYNKNTF